MRVMRETIFFFNFKKLMYIISTIYCIRLQKLTVYSFLLLLLLLQNNLKKYLNFHAHNYMHDLVHRIT